ncbi:MAG TPA: ImmA/IrrE family metallo-endopeptidase, partial [Thermoanaerobaculia bacterium]|nr:ImmA/IrrE family metallo-endopeptidase [Thermoanaerobaculia bacterium]
GHVVLHTKELIARALHPFKPSLNRRSEHAIFRDTEWQGDAFAAAFIAPLQAVLQLHDEIGYLSPTEIAQTFGLSKQAAAIRLDNVLDLVPRRRLRIVGRDPRRQLADWS